MDCFVAFAPRKDTGVVPAKAGTHTPCRSFERRCSMTFAQQLRAVVMGPGSRFACPGRQWWIFDSSFKQPIIFSRREAPKLCQQLPSRKEGAGNAGCALHPQSRVQNKKAHEVVTTGSPEQPGIPRAMVLTVSFVISPVIGLCCHRHRQVTTCPLDASVEASGPHDFAVRVSTFRQACYQRPPHPVPTFVTIAKRPFVWDGMAGVLELIWGSGEAEYFCKRDWTVNWLICPSGSRHPSAAYARGVDDERHQSGRRQSPNRNH
jgi:hypothetical protein